MTARTHAAVWLAVMIPACLVMFGMPVVLVVAGMLRVMEWLA